MVEGTINGFRFQAALEPDGKGSHWFRADKTMREAAGAKAGDTVTLAIEPTRDWPEPKVPADLKSALTTDPQAHTLWMDITPMARWDWIRWIGSTKQPETRSRRIEVACSKLKTGQRRPCCLTVPYVPIPLYRRMGCSSSRADLLYNNMRPGQWRPGVTAGNPVAGPGLALASGKATPVLIEGAGQRQCTVTAVIGRSDDQRAAHGIPRSALPQSGSEFDQRPSQSGGSSACPARPRVWAMSVPGIPRVFTAVSDCSRIGRPDTIGPAEPGHRRRPASTRQAEDEHGPRSPPRRPPCDRTSIDWGTPARY